MRNGSPPTWSRRPNMIRRGRHLHHTFAQAGAASTSGRAWNRRAAGAPHRRGGAYRAGRNRRHSQSGRGSGTGEPFGSGTSHPVRGRDRLVGAHSIRRIDLPWRLQPVAAGDYASGTNHILPTGGAARLRGGLSAADFVKAISVQRLSERGLAGLQKTIVTLANTEGLKAHSYSVQARSAKMGARD